MKPTLMTACLIALIAAQPAHAAGTGSAGGPSVTLTYSVEDATFDGPECAQVPWSLTYTKPMNTDLSVRMYLEQESSNSRIDEDREQRYDTSTSGVVSGVLCVPTTADVTLGGFHLAPEVDVMDSGALTTVLGQRVPLTVTRNPSRFVNLRVRTAINMSWITGRAVAQAPGKGTIGATGWVHFQRLGRKGWRTIGREWIGFGYGEFQETLWDPIPRGTRIRAILNECMWCTDARSVTRVRAR